MEKEKNKYAFDSYIQGKEALGKLPLFYRYFEFYEDEISLDVENCNMVFSRFHQSHKHNIGFASKSAAWVKFDPEKLLYKLQ